MLMISIQAILSRTAPMFRAPFSMSARKFQLVATAWSNLVEFWAVEGTKPLGAARIALWFPGVPGWFIRWVSWKLHCYRGGWIQFKKCTKRPDPVFFHPAPAWSSELQKSHLAPSRQLTDKRTWEKLDVVSTERALFPHLMPRGSYYPIFRDYCHLSWESLSAKQ